MKRDLDALTGRTHDLLVIGGGITGATIARDAAQRGLKVALVEMKDFNHGTSSGSTKLVHGGLRYLQNGEIRLVRESLRERRIWARIAPHMVDPLPFLIPVYHSRLEGFVLRIGLTLYDILSMDRNWQKDPSKRMPGHKWLTAAEALARVPDLPAEGLRGALLYYDCQMYAPERLGLECLLEAADKGAAIANCARVTGLLKDGGRCKGAEVLDERSGKTFAVSARVTINAAGPWADHVLTAAEGERNRHHLLRSKGIHIITRELSGSTALLLKAEGDHLFVIPWRGKTIVGTTDTAFRKAPEALEVEESDIEEVLRKLKEAMPATNITRADVVHAYAGLRPLIDTDNNPANNDTQETYTASRKAEIVDHADEGLAGLWSALGGKWTTSRHVAERLVTRVLKKEAGLSVAHPACLSADLPTWCGDTGPYFDFVHRQIAANPGWDPLIIEHLARLYGSRCGEIIGLAEETGLKALLDPAEPTLEAEILHAIRNEMALTLEDILMRRTELGTIAPPGHQALERMAELAAAELGWDDTRRAAEIEAVRTAYAKRAGEVS